MIESMEVFQITSVEVFAEVWRELLGEGIQDFAAYEATKSATIVSVVEKGAEDFGTCVDYDGDSHWWHKTSRI